MQNTPALPIILIALLCCLTGTTASTSVKAERLKQAYIDNNRNVHIVTARSHNIQITNNRNSAELKLAPDNTSVASFE